MDNDNHSDEHQPTLPELIWSMGDHLTHKDRPFTGQPHTYDGERGKQELSGIRMRDLADCVARAFVDSTLAIVMDEDEELAERLRQGRKDGTLNYNDLYKLPIDRMDPVALIQNITCQVEDAMGIWPNLPGEKPRSREDDES